MEQMFDFENNRILKSAKQIISLFRKRSVPYIFTFSILNLEQKIFLKSS